MNRILLSALLIATIGCQAQVDESGKEARPRPGGKSENSITIEQGHLNVCVVGFTNDRHLRLAIELIKQFSSGNQQCPTASELSQQATQGVTYIEYTSERNHYAHLVFPSGITPMQLYSTSHSADVVIVLPNERGEIDQQTINNLHIARAAGVTQLVVFSPKENSEGLRDITSIGFLRNQTVVGDIHHPQQLKELIKSIDREFKARRESPSSSFVMPIEDVFSIQGQGIIATGRVESGVVRKGDALEIVGLGRRTDSRVQDLEFFHGQLDSASTGDNVGVLLKGVTTKDVARGSILTEKGALTLASKFDAELSVPIDTKDEKVTILIRSASIPAAVMMARPGEQTTTINGKFTFNVAHAIEVGNRFVILNKDRFVATGRITSIQQ